MRISGLLTAIPLLASLATAVPAKRSQLVLERPEGDEQAHHTGFALDLDELRLVQFAEDEPPV